MSRSIVALSARSSALASGLSPFSVLKIAASSVPQPSQACWIANLAISKSAWAAAAGSGVPSPPPPTFSLRPLLLTDDCASWPVVT
jgi:hypothetical protein